MRPGSRRPSLRRPDGGTSVRSADVGVAWCRRRLPQGHPIASLIAVISEDRSRPAPPAELDALLDELTSLRGPGTRRRARVGRWAHVVLVENGVPGDHQEGDGGWHLAVGAPRGGPLWRASPDELDGVFAAVRYSEPDDVLEVLSDPFGLQALHVARRGGLTYVSTSAAALARHLGAAPDPVGAAVFLRTGQQYGPVTHWEGIERLQAATRVAFDRRGRTVSTYWLAQVDPSIRRLDLRGTVDRLEDVSLDMVRPLKREPCVEADLTGGLDTRLVAACMLHEGVAFQTHTTGADADVDVVLAREVARAAGVPWRQEQLPPGWAPDDLALRAAVEWGDGRLDALELSEVLHHHQQRATRCSVVVAGVGGEHLSPFPWLQEHLRAGRSSAINWDNLMSMRLLLPVDLSVFRRDPTPDAEAYARDVLGRHADRYADEPNTTRLDALHAYRQPGHSGAFRSAAELAVRLEAPCHSRAFFTVAFSANHRWRNGVRLHRGVIERLSPAVADIATQRGGPAVTTRPGNVLRFAPYYTRLGRSAIRKLTRTPAVDRTMTPNRAAARLAAVGRLREAGVLSHATMRTAHLYDAARFTAFVDRSSEPAFRDWPMLGRIATLELALRAGERAGAHPTGSA